MIVPPFPTKLPRHPYHSFLRLTARCAWRPHFTGISTWHSLSSRLPGVPFNLCHLPTSLGLYAVDFNYEFPAAPSKQHQLEPTYSTPHSISTAGSANFLHGSSLVRCTNLMKKLCPAIAGAHAELILYILSLIPSSALLSRFGRIVMFCWRHSCCQQNFFCKHSTFIPSLSCPHFTLQQMFR